VTSICIFCGSKPGARPAYREAAVAIGTLLAQRGVRLVYGGAQRGTMGMVADAVLEAGGVAVGILPSTLADQELAHTGLTELHIVDSLAERKDKMAAMSDGFAVLPGGCGTLDELFEVVTWAQLGLHEKPIGILNLEGYYDHLLGFLDTCVAERFLSQQHRDMLRVATTPTELLDAMAVG
jgi:hypothetical protein